MTEASKQRAKEFLNKMGKHPVWMHEDFLLGYEAGMQDPDAVNGVVLTDQNLRRIEKLKAENKRLREVMQFAVDHLSSMGDYSIVNGAIHSLKEAVSSGEVES